MPEADCKQLIPFGKVLLQDFCLCITQRFPYLKHGKKGNYDVFWQSLCTLSGREARMGPVPFPQTFVKVVNCFPFVGNFN